MATLKLTTKHNGKMKYMQSLSTSCHDNSRCRKNAEVEGSICQKCYANKMLKMYKAADEAFRQNGEILRSRILTDEELPTINSLFFRFEAFGDLENVTQMRNYLHIVQKNPLVKFAIWTKNPDIIKKAFTAEGITEESGKPENLQIVRSSLFLNKKVRAGYWFVDKVFTVYSADYIQQHDITINCGAKSCFNCHKCYTQNDITEISEKLK